MLWETLANIPSWKDLDQLERIASGRGNITALNVGHTRNQDYVSARRISCGCWKSGQQAPGKTTANGFPMAVIGAERRQS